MILLELTQHFFFFQLILTTLTKTFKLFSTPSNNITSTSVHDRRISTKPHCDDHGSLRRDEVERLMEDLGVLFHQGGERLPEVLSCGYVYDVFEAEGPGLEEVKEAFDVFDANKDGFIDAGELQRVVCVMGLKEGVEMEDCRKMIGVFDEDGDGRIDFNEFVKFMENTFC